MPEIDNVFEKDELKLASIKPNQSIEEVLSKKSIFFLKDVTRLLNLDAGKIIRMAKSLDDPYGEIGLRKMWGHWVLRMTVFRPYYENHIKYRDHFFLKIKSINPSWDANELLAQDGWFFLSQVCRILPFFTNQIRYRVLQSNNPKVEIGCWRDEETKRFVVDMPVFREWIKRLQSGDFST